MQFLGCIEEVDIKQQNKQLVQNLDAYLSSEALDPAEKQENRQKVADYYKEKLQTGDDIRVSEIAQQLPGMGADNNFEAFVRASEIPTEASFQPDKAMLSTLGKFSGQGGGISISFDRKFYGDRVTYDPQTDTLTIKGLPPNLKDQLSR